MLKFNKKTEYGLMALKYLAHESGGLPASARDIANKYHMPYPLLAKVLHKLAHEGVIHSQQGSNGGYVITQEVGNISIADVITALEFRSRWPG